MRKNRNIHVLSFQGPRCSAPYQEIHFVCAVLISRVQACLCKGRWVESLGFLCLCLWVTSIKNQFYPLRSSFIHQKPINSSETLHFWIYIVLSYLPSFQWLTEKLSSIGCVCIKGSKTQKCLLALLEICSHSSGFAMWPLNSSAILNIWCCGVK